FKATIRAEDGSVLTDRSIVWSSSNENVASVSPATGLATGISAGTASITAEVEGKTGATDLTVRQPLTIDPPSIRLGILSQPRQLRLFFNGVEVPPQQAQWRSSNTGVATVNGLGRVTPRGFGNATITAEFQGHSAPAAVEVVLFP